jgi:hypothetical protein
MKRLKFDVGKFLLYGAAIYQAYQVGRALAILDPGGWKLQGVSIGGLFLGAIVNLTVAYSATQLPGIKAKSRKTWSTGNFFFLVTLSPILIAPALYLVITPEVNQFWRLILSFGYSIAPDAAIALAGFVAGKSLIPLLNGAEQSHKSSHSDLVHFAHGRRAKSSHRTASRTAKRANSQSGIVCRYAGAGCEEIFGSQNAENAHARWCKFKPTISMPAEAITNGTNKK